MGLCPLDCDKKDLAYAVGVTFGGILRDFCRLRIQVDVQKPLRPGIFVLVDSKVKTWVPFKYENLPVFCFKCGNMGHGVKDCELVTMEEKENRALFFLTRWC